MNFEYCNGETYVVRKGDSLYTLSRKFNVPLALILWANPYVDIYNLQVGDQICIPRRILPVPTPNNVPMEERQGQMPQPEMMPMPMVTPPTPGMQTPGMPTGAPTPGMPSTGMPSTGMPSTGMPSTGMPSTGMPSTGMPSTGMPSTGMPSTGMPSTGMPSTGMPSTGMPSTGMPSTGMPSTGMPSTGMPSTGMPSTGMPSTGMPSTGMPSTLRPQSNSPFINIVPFKSNYSKFNNMDLNAMPDNGQSVIIIEYVVQDKDTIGRIMDIFEITMDDIMKYNDLNDIMLYPGSTLKIPQEKEM